jgi:hypothetical protein
LIPGAHKIACRKAGEGFKCLVAMGYNVVLIDDKSRYGQSVKDLREPFLTLSDSGVSAMDPASQRLEMEIL